jgi:hypothetical protein
MRGGQATAKHENCKDFAQEPEGEVWSWPIALLRWNLMSAFRVLRTSCEADTKQIGSE